ncbi:MAG: hypothetical protein M0R21_09380 [Lentimicrobiaceae bacterium]|jgi:hypothetical protein|nr:hypothetical protein [Lentimicrobiaceae bacterium]
MGNWDEAFNDIETNYAKIFMRTKKLYFIILIFLFTGISLFAQEKPYNLIKFGVKGFGGITDTCYLNTMVTDWFNKVVDASNAELQSDPVTLPFNIEYGYQPFIIIRPLRLLQIGVKMDYAFSSLTVQFQNQLINQNYELNIKKKSYNPGVFAYLTLGKMELGGGLFRSYTYLDITDDFFGYKDKWYGTNTGYELSLGFSSSREKHVGFTMGIRYRDLLINEFEDNLKRKITYSDNQENISLNMSGFFIEMGLYFQFVKIKKQKNEN